MQVELPLPDTLTFTQVLEASPYSRKTLRTRGYLPTGVYNHKELYPVEDVVAWHQPCHTTTDDVREALRRKYNSEPAFIAPGEFQKIVNIDAHNLLGHPWPAVQLDEHGKRYYLYTPLATWLAPIAQKARLEVGELYELLVSGTRQLVTPREAKEYGRKRYGNDWRKEGEAAYPHASLPGKIAHRRFLLPTDE